MKRKAVGFYWTLPVPWIGFRDLGETIEDAAVASRTIRFQRALIHDFARRQRYQIIHEEAFLEIEPDRGSRYIRSALDKASVKCRQNGAELLYVDFSGVHGWRGHSQMQDWLEENSVVSVPIEADPVTIDGEPFDPHSHFSSWRERQWEWISKKDERAEKAQSRAVALKTLGLKNPAIASVLNSEGIRSLSGQPWTADSLRKFLSGLPS